MQVQIFHAGMGWMVPPINMGALEQNFMPDALPVTTPVSQMKISK